jgi:uncharacterized protein
MKHCIVWLIKCYQRTFSPDHGWGRLIYPSAGCRYYPSCSEYARQSILKQGVARGTWEAAKRLWRCHPWAEGGIDQPA